MNYRGKRALVIGLGKSGQAAVRFLLARGAIVAAADARTRDDLGPTAEKLAKLPVELHFGAHSDDLMLRQDLILPSPGVPWNLPGLVSARRRGITVSGELEVASRELQGSVIGVTGTNGKTTTASLIGHVLRRAGVPGSLAGNIGIPVLDIVDSSRPDHWHVLELSSFQLEASESFRCRIAAVLNVTPDHLDRHGAFADYASAKARILRNQRQSDSALLNAEDPQCRAMESRARGRVVRFGPTCRPGVAACVDHGRIVFEGQEVVETDLPIKGVHNLENALAAVAACALAGVGPAAIAAALRTFRPVPHRLEFVARVAGVDYYNDSKATNVAAAVKACASFGSGLWPILGGRDKGSDYAPLADTLRGRTKAALLVGEAAPLIRRQLDNCVETVETGTVDAAVEYVAAHAGPGDTVVLAPACASFDQYANYIERGRAFQRLVRQLEG